MKSAQSSMSKSLDFVMFLCGNNSSLKKIGAAVDVFFAYEVPMLLVANHDNALEHMPQWQGTIKRKISELNEGSILEILRNTMGEGQTADAGLVFLIGSP